MMRNALRVVAFALTPLLASCATTMTPLERVRAQDGAMAHPEPNTTPYTSAVDRFGDMLRAYPTALREPVVPIVVQKIRNDSGFTDGVPPNLAGQVRTVLQQIGQPLVVVDVDREEAAYDLSLLHYRQISRMTMRRRQPILSLRGSTTEAERRVTTWQSLQIDGLLPLRSGRESITTHPGGSVTTLRRDEELDIGFGTDREVEVTTLAIDFQLYDYQLMSSLDRLAESYRINVVRSDRSNYFGIFFEGSGLGFRSRISGTQSKSRALRMASELAVLHLLGRYFSVPWWRAIEGAPTDTELVEWYRDDLNPGNAASKLKLLLYAHGYDVDLDVAELTPAEINFSRLLKQQFGMPTHGSNNHDLIVRLWETVPFEGTERRIETLRNNLISSLAETAGKPAAEQAKTEAPASSPPAETAASNPPAAAPVVGSALLSPPPTYPTVSRCCPFRFDGTTGRRSSEGG